MADILSNKQKVTILGAGGLAREVDSWVSNDSKTSLEVVGFWDDNVKALDSYATQKKVLGNIDFSNIKGEVLIGIMDCNFKSQIINKLESVSNVSVLSYIHESVIIGDRTSLGDGVVLFPNVIVSCDVIIGKGTFLNLGTQIGHDVKIDENVSVMPSVNLGGGVEIGANVFIGTGSVILPGVKIPSNTRIGAGSVVVKSIKKAGTYFGNPAKKIF